MTKEQLELIREWDAKCGDNEAVFFPVTKDRRRLIEHVDELRELLSLCRARLPEAGAADLAYRVDVALD